MQNLHTEFLSRRSRGTGVQSRERKSADSFPMQTSARGESTNFKATQRCKRHRGPPTKLKSISSHCVSKSTMAGERWSKEGGGWAPGGTGRRASVCVGSGDAAGGEGGSVRGEAFVAVRSPVKRTLVVPAVVRFQLQRRSCGSQVIFITTSGLGAYVNVVVGAKISIEARAQAA